MRGSRSGCAKDARDCAIDAGARMQDVLISFPSFDLSYAMHACDTSDYIRSCASFLPAATLQTVSVYPCMCIVSACSILKLKEKKKLKKGCVAHTHTLVVSNKQLHMQPACTLNSICTHQKDIWPLVSFEKTYIHVYKK